MLRFSQTGMGLSTENFFFLLCFETSSCIHLKYQMFKAILNPEALFFKRNLKSSDAFQKSGNISPSVLDTFSEFGKSILPT